MQTYHEKVRVRLYSEILFSFHNIQNIYTMEFTSSWSSKNPLMLILWGTNDKKSDRNKTILRSPPLMSAIIDSDLMTAFFAPPLDPSHKNWDTDDLCRH